MTTKQSIRRSQNTHPRRINIDPEKIENGLAKLVLTLVELIRKLLEKQAIRRIEGGSLSDEEVERIGEALMKLEHKVQELKDLFGLKDEDLNLISGPLSDLI
ncbi:MAG: gas vesicle protein K [Nitrospirota bacterium]